MAKKNAIQDFSGEIGIAALVVAVVALMVLPLPTMLIDALLGLNITLSVVLLMVTMYIPSATSLSAFPDALTAHSFACRPPTRCSCCREHREMLLPSKRGSTPRRASWA